jgi:hypothetical protein
MIVRFSVHLQASPEQFARLEALQQLFVKACNSLTPVVRETRCWNRVGLHHMVYRQLREKFPQLGSQMACNAIYSVSRACRIVYQSPGSPWLAGRQPDQTLPLIKFEGAAPVYFDRHTLSLRGGVVSMFTLDGRMRFQINLSSEQEAHFVRDRLREVVLQSRAGVYSLSFVFLTEESGTSAEGQSDEHLPEYLVIQQNPSQDLPEVVGDTPDMPRIAAVVDRSGPLLTGVA